MESKCSDAKYKENVDLENRILKGFYGQRGMHLIINKKGSQSSRLIVWVVTYFYNNYNN